MRNDIQTLTFIEKYFLVSGFGENESILNIFECDDGKDNYMLHIEKIENPSGEPFCSVELQRKIRSRQFYKTIDAIYCDEDQINDALDHIFQRHFKRPPEVEFRDDAKNLRMIPITEKSNYVTLH